MFFEFSERDQKRDQKRDLKRDRSVEQKTKNFILAIWNLNCRVPTHTAGRLLYLFRWLAKRVGCSIFLVILGIYSRRALFQRRGKHSAGVGDESSGYSAAPFRKGYLHLCDVQHALQIARRPNMRKMPVKRGNLGNLRS